MKNIGKIRFSWSGIIAGIVVGLVAFLTAISLGAAITAITGLDLYGTSILAIVWGIISIIASSYVAGVVAMLVNRPNYEFVEVEVEKNTIETNLHRYRKDAGITGLVTGSLIVLLVTYATISGLGSVVSGGLKLFGVTGAGLATTTIAAGSQDDINSYLQNISTEEIEQIIAQNVDNLDQQQISATANVVERIYTRTKNDLANTNITNLVEKVQNRYTNIENEITGPNFVKNLQAQGLSESKAAEVQRTIQSYINKAKKNVEEAVKAARIAMFTASILYAIYIGLILGATTLGARSIRHTEEKLDETKVKTEKK